MHTQLAMASGFCSSAHHHRQPAVQAPARAPHTHTHTPNRPLKHACFTAEAALTASAAGRGPARPGTATTMPCLGSAPARPFRVTQSRGRQPRPQPGTPLRVHAGPALAAVGRAASTTPGPHPTAWLDAACALLCSSLLAASVLAHRRSAAAQRATVNTTAGSGRASRSGAVTVTVTAVQPPAPEGGAQLQWPGGLEQPAALACMLFLALSNLLFKLMPDRHVHAAPASGLGGQGGVGVPYKGDYDCAAATARCGAADRLAAAWAPREESPTSLSAACRPPSPLAMTTDAAARLAHVEAALGKQAGDVEAAGRQVDKLQIRTRLVNGDLKRPMAQVTTHTHACCRARPGAFVGACLHAVCTRNASYNNNV